MKDYSVLDGMARQMKDCLITAYNKGYSRGYEDGWAVRSEYEPKIERQTEKTCDNCLLHGHCEYYGKTLTWLLGDKNEQTGEKVCKSWKPNGAQMHNYEEKPQSLLDAYFQMRKESHD